MDSKIKIRRINKTLKQLRAALKLPGYESPDMFDVAPIFAGRVNPVHVVGGFSRIGANRYLPVLLQKYPKASAFGVRFGEGPAAEQADEYEVYTPERVLQLAKDALSQLKEQFATARSFGGHLWLSRIRSPENKNEVHVDNGSRSEK